MDVTPMQIVDLMTIGASLNFGFLAFVQFRENLRLPVEAKIDIDLENTRHLYNTNNLDEIDYRKKLHFFQKLQRRSKQTKYWLDKADPWLSSICMACGLACVYFVFLAAFCPSMPLASWKTTIAVLASIGWLTSMLANVTAYAYISWGIDILRKSA